MNGPMNYFYFDNEKILILTRKNCTKKPKHYLFNPKKKKYISSLYPTNIENQYTFDYEQTMYKLIQDTETNIWNYEKI